MQRAKKNGTYNLIYSLYQDIGEDIFDMSIAEISGRFDLTYHAARHARQRLRREIDVENSGIKSILHTKSGEQINGGYVKQAWSKTDEGTIHVVYNNPEEDEEIDVIELFKDAFKKGAIPKPETPNLITRIRDDDIIVKFVHADLHMGMHSWGEQTGADYDLKIAVANLQQNMDRLIESTPLASTCIIEDLGDVFHMNDSKNETPESGHRLDTDGRVPKVLLETLKAKRYCVDQALRKFETVEITGVSGNHDKDLAHSLTLGLMAAYDGNPRVKVHWNPGKWWVRQFGKNMFVAHHGDRINFNRIAEYVPAVWPKIWGETEYRYVDTGHVHHERVKDIGGMTIRSYRTVAAADNYAASSGFYSRRSMHAQTFHKEEGQIIENMVNIT